MASPATNDEGLATITDMPVQAYLVCETTTPGNIVQKAKPFVVTVPHPNTAAGADGQWIYDVHVYPKNEAISVEKSIQEQKLNGYGVGSATAARFIPLLAAVRESRKVPSANARSIMAARLISPYTGLFQANPRVRAVIIPARNPVNGPGPVPVSTASTAAPSSPVSAKTCAA